MLLAVLFTALPASAVQLRPEDAIGGELITLTNGTVAVTHSHVVTAASMKYGWNLASPLTNGWWHVKLTLAANQNWSLGIGLLFSGSPYIRLYPSSDLDLNPVLPSQHEFWYYALSTVTNFQIFRTETLAQAQADPLRTLPILGIEIDDNPSPPPDDTSLRLYVEMHGVDDNGPVRIAPGLPAGNYSFRIKSFGSNSPATVTIRDKDGTTGTFMPRFNPTDDYVTTVSFHQGIAGVTVSSPTKLPQQQYVWAEHYPELQLTDYSKGVALNYTKLFQDGLEVSQEFHLFGDSVSGQAPSLPFFPDGSHTALLLSFDDGFASDLPLAQALNSIGARATFFLLFNKPGFNFAPQLETLGMEVGAHTLQHPYLSRCNPQQAFEEVGRIRPYLERKVGHPVFSFAYPYGDYVAFDTSGPFVLNAVGAAGYLSARTTRETDFNITDSSDPFQMPVTKHMLPIPTFEGDLQAGWNHARTNAPGAVVHWWGHSWEFTDTHRLTNVLAGYMNQPDVWYATQGDLTLWRWIRNNAVVTTSHPQLGETAVRITYPALHPFLNRLPMAITVPPGVTNVTVEGKSVAVVNGVVSVAPPAPRGVPAPTFTGVLELSTNATDWVSIGTNTVSSDQLTSVFGATPTNAFYRFRWVIPNGSQQSPVPPHILIGP